MSSDQVCDAGQDYTSEQDHMITKDDHMTGGQDHEITKDHDKGHMSSEQDHMINEQQSSSEDMTGQKDDVKHQQTNMQDHVTPDVSHNTMYYEASSRISLPGNSNDVTDGGNTYDVQKELDEILSKSDLVDGTHLNLPTQVTTNNTTASATSSATVDDDSVVVMDTSTSLTKSDQTQTSPSTNSKSDNLELPPMSDSVKPFVFHQPLRAV